MTWPYFYTPASTSRGAVTDSFLSFPSHLPCHPYIFVLPSTYSPFPFLIRSRLETYYSERLHRRRPVLLFVRGFDVCSLLDDLSAPTHQRSLGVNTMYSGGNPGIPTFPSNRIEPQGEMVKRIRRPAPLALMTTGWDNSGSPFAEHRWSGCATKIIELPRVVRWFVSHHHGADPGPKVRATNVAIGCFLGPERGAGRARFTCPSGRIVSECRTTVLQCEHC